MTPQSQKSKKAKRLFLQIVLGVIIFVAIVGVVLGLSIVFGLLKTPITGTTTDTGENSGVVNESLFPYSTDEYRVEYSGSGDVIRVYMFPSLDSPGTIDEKQENIQSEVTSWLTANGVDTDAVTIEWRTK